MLNFLQSQFADSLAAAPAQMLEKLASSKPEELLSSFLDQALHFGLKVLAALAIYFIGGWIISKIKKMLGKVFKKKSTEPAIASFVMSLVSITLTVILIILTVGTLGINTSSLAALLAAGGMAIGMALSGTVQNFAGGIMILVFKPFKSGDFIEAQGFAGVVTDVNIVSTKLTTGDNKTIVIPNGALSSGTINNYSKQPLRRVDWTVSVEYGSNPEEVKKAILSILKADSRVLDSSKNAPADPFIALSNLGASSVDYVVRAWVNAADYWDVFFNVNEKVYTELPQKGVNFPFPQLDVTVKNK